MYRVEINVSFENRKPTVEEINALKDLGVNQIEVMKKTVTTYNFMGGQVVMDDELDECHMNIFMDIPKNWPSPDHPFNPDTIEEEVTTMLVGVFGDMDDTPSGALIPDYPVWYLEDVVLEGQE